MFATFILYLVVLFYLPYYQDYTIFTNMLVQGSKYSQSILLLLMQKGNSNLFGVINSLAIPVFAIIYITILGVLLFKKKIILKEILKKYNLVMLIFIFIVLTNFQKWYILWLMPTIIWQIKNMRKFILYLTITAIVPSYDYFMVQGDPFIIGMGYSAKILIMSTVIWSIDILISKYIRIKGKKEKLCRV